MANALKTLFTNIAESIRKGLPNEGTMMPLAFPEKIDKIVSLLQNGSGSGAGEAVGDWETIVEEQTATAVYDSITLSNLMHIPATKIVLDRDFNTIDIYRVWFDGVAYLCAPYLFKYKFSQEVFGLTEVRNVIVGNPNLLKGRMMTGMTFESDYNLPPSEPFAVLEYQASIAEIAVGDTNPHTVRIDRIPRGAVTTS